MMHLSSRRIIWVAASLGVAVLFLLAIYDGLHTRQSHHPPGPNRVVSHRKLLQQQGKAAGTERIGEACTQDDIVVFQGATAPLPNGIPTYTVEVLNTCTTGCAISRVHLSCGQFSSARLINPRIFRRLRINDCLVNDGRPIPAGSAVTFSYANSFSFPLAVSSVQCPT